MNQEKSVRRAKRIFKQAFLALVREKGYKNVTVKDIVERADYNRTTFYVYYRDKEELTEEIVGEMLAELDKALSGPFRDKGFVDFDKISPASVQVFRHISANTEFYSLLAEPGLIPGLQDKVIEIIRQFQKHIRFSSNLSRLDINNEQFITFRTYGIYGVILEWIKSGYTLSIEEVSQQLIDIHNAHSPNAYMK